MEPKAWPIRAIAAGLLRTLAVLLACAAGLAVGFFGTYIVAAVLLQRAMPEWRSGEGSMAVMGLSTVAACIGALVGLLLFGLLAAFAVRERRGRR